jgi:nickel transport protein
MSARKLILAAPPALLLTLLLLVAWRTPAQAHGVEIIAGPGRAVVINGMYSDGEPMSFVKIKVTTPQGKTHQVGNSDANGSFAFVPDHPGEWLVVASDGMGHRAETTWQQEAGKTAPAGSSESQPAQAPAQPMKASKWERAAWGLSLLFWLSGLVFWRKGARKQRQA